MTSTRSQIETPLASLRSSTYGTTETAGLHVFGLVYVDVARYGSDRPTADVIAFDVDSIAIDERTDAESGSFLRLTIKNARGETLVVNLHNANTQTLSSALGAHDLEREAEALERDGMTL